MSRSGAVPSSAPSNHMNTCTPNLGHPVCAEPLLCGVPRAPGHCRGCCSLSPRLLSLVPYNSPSLACLLARRSLLSLSLSVHERVRRPRGQHPSRPPYMSSLRPRRDIPSDESSRFSICLEFFASKLMISTTGGLGSLSLMARPALLPGPVGSSIYCARRSRIVLCKVY